MGTGPQTVEFYGTAEVTVSSDEALALAELAKNLADVPVLDRTVERVVRCATELTAAEDGSVVLVRGAQRLEPLGASDEAAEQADAWQDRLHEGPCVSAAREHRSFLVRDVMQDDRWPRWGPIAADLGVRGAVSTCLSTRRRTVGMLNLYTSYPDRLDDADAARAQAVADHAAVAIDNMREESDLRRAMETRNVIGQAQGLLMERYELDARRAFEVLRRYSQDTNVKLRDVAEQLVETRKLPDDL
ncbi:GAF and ANTAR domain-containing protein [Phytoactinopolyspora halotolerans]|uniref:GAF and ANTAR domain-containing protein n=1 Tax=Phytoactinopolyspora halotolerans TaxID=1981512 RepID=A0A6L9S3V3_9ACTN|nr:GAF and ANTAR domain-containing protein [Phytoactinopolyspora halotolerans]NED99343.1 GAF and ANTAR domain-containing protein [Phytoactinopolyspora halotolerans]